MRVVQVGVGGWGRSWAQVARDAPEVELVAVVDPDPRAREWAAAELGLGAGGCHATLDEALRAEPCDAVLVITPPETHLPVVRAALQVGKHVLVEKPLATGLADARALVELAAARDRLLVVDQNYRFRPPARTVRELVSDGAVGRLSAVRAVCRRDTRSQWARDNFRYTMRHPYVLDMSIHHFDLVRALTGQDVVSIYSRSWRVPDSPYAHDPAMVAVLALSDGCTVGYDGDWATHGPQTTFNGDWELVGESGRVLWRGGDADREQVWLQRWGEPPCPVAIADPGRSDRAAVLATLAAAVPGGPAPETAAADNIRSLAVVFGCVQSIESGGLVDVGQLLAGA